MTLENVYSYLHKLHLRLAIRRHVPYCRNVWQSLANLVNHQRFSQTKTIYVNQ